LVLGASAIALVAIVAGLGAWLGTRDADTRRLAVLGVSDPNSPRADFNGDGFSDLAVGMQAEDVVRSFPRESIQSSGAAQVVYGSADGLAAAGAGLARASQLWHQDSSGVDDSLEEDDQFGAAVVAGDFNGDGRSDLAAAVRLEDNNAGAVHVIYGSADGLSTVRYLTPDQILRPADLGSSGLLFGPSGAFALAWGNFDGDDFGDLVVATSNAQVGTTIQAGAVYVVYGSAAGLNPSRRQTWNQDNIGSIASPAYRDRFGSAVAAGDFDGDDVDDLAVGVPLEDGASLVDSGEVNVLYGVAGSGLSATGAQRWRQGSGGILSSPKANGSFGGVLAAGDFNGDLRDDLVVGAPRDDTAADYGGAVNVIYGSANGLVSSGGGVPGTQLWHQDSVDEGSEIDDQAEVEDFFGRALAAGDFDGDGSDDLAVASSEDVGTIELAGAVNVIYGSSAEGLDASGDELFHQDRSGIDDEAERYDAFGTTLAAWNFGNGAEDDLAVAVPYEDIGAVEAGGLVHVIYGDSGSGLTSSGSQVWTQDSEGVPDAMEFSDIFGLVLAQ
jgi:hypothetical protein